MKVKDLIEQLKDFDHELIAIMLFLIVIYFHIIAISIMFEKKEVDHALLLEDFAFISAIIFQKNYINRNNVEIGLPSGIEPTVEDPNVTSVQEEQQLAAKELINSGLKAEVKEYILITDIETDIKKVYNKKYPYEIDGLIFVKPGDTYLLTKSYKWKDTDHNTIDFLVKKAPDSVLGLLPFVTKPKYTMYFLFVGITNEMYQALGLRRCLGYDEIFIDNTIGNYFPIQFSLLKLYIHIII
jgi:hypothetical protein